MEKIENVKRSQDASKYNLRCNRNISEKMTKKDFIYDIPAPFQAARKDKCVPSECLKRPRTDLECLITSSGSKNGAKSNGKNSIGLVRLIQPQKLIPGIRTSSDRCISKALNPLKSCGEIKERIAMEPERCGTSTDETETEEIRRQIVLPIQLRRKIGSDSKPPRYSVIPTNEETQLTNSNCYQIPEKKILEHQCNYCLERVATLMSLSTHVKYHCENRHCNTCFWILEPQETMSQHIRKTHQFHFLPRL